MPVGEPRDPNTAGRAPSGVYRLAVAVRPDRAEAVAAALWARGATGVWEQPDTLVAWFPVVASSERSTADGTDAPVLGDVPDVPELAPGRQHWSVEPDRDWQAEWKATIAPVRAGRVVVVPTWLAADHRPTDGELTLVLDPGRAFGSGHHATTTLCLEFLDDLDAAGALAGRTVADVGCGTGVLGIAAAAWGAEVTAVDIDPEAVEMTRDNAARNGVRLTAAVGSAGELPPSVDVVVANLVTDVIVALADALVAATGSTLVVSGIAVERRDRALDALVRAGARTVEVRERDGWIAARLERVVDPGGAP